MSVFARVALAPSDPILGVTDAWRADPRPTKVNLGVGVYYDEQGRLTLLEAVKRADAVSIKIDRAVMENTETVCLSCEG